MEHYKKYGNSKSLGIATFSTAQQRAILETLEVELKADPSFEKYFNDSTIDGFFVKNLENIQGDERDVILISIGYGYDRDKKLTLNFGPLNRDGGEKRLNVLITRAREKCVVFSNFKSKNLQLKENSPIGLKVLKHFLYYAEHKEFDHSYKTGEDFDSPFEKSVYNFLVDKGYEVEKQIGCAGFRIDLAIMDKYNKDEYIIGIECDGASYHSSKTARDRDRIRQDILEGLGWIFHKIWSTEWYNYRHNAQNNLIMAIESAYENRKNIKKSKELKNIWNSNKDIEIEIETVKNKPKNKSILYKEFTTNKRSDFYNNRHEATELIDKIIEYESPIHKNEIYNKIKTIYNTKATKKFRENIDIILQHLIYNSSRFKSKEDFYYISPAIIRIRKRNKPDISLICDNEIKKAIIETLKNQFSMDNDSLAKSASELLGFSILRGKTKEKFLKIIHELLKDKTLRVNKINKIELNH